ncbi:MAG: DMT family transporter [Lachnospiraceae bacterium]|nr:DMT family transporter [Lachnospiraceae bacterium]
MKNKDNTVVAYLCLIVVFFCWGSVYVANRYILQALEPMELACCRFVLSALALGIAIKVQGIHINVQKSDWKYMIFFGFMGYYLSMECTLLSVDYAGASMASLINSLNPVFITAFAVFFLKEALTRRKVFCLILGLIGVVIVSGTDTAGSQFIGVVYGIVSILTWAWAVMYSRRLSARYNPLVITFLGIAVSLIFHIPTAAVTVAQNGMPEITPMIVVCIFYSALCGTALPQFLWNYSLSKLEASSCSMLYPLMPIFSAILGVALLGEEITTSFLVGGALILSTVVISCLGGHGHTTSKHPGKVH